MKIKKMQNQNQPMISPYVFVGLPEMKERTLHDIIIETVARYTDLTVDQITSNTRLRNISIARQITMYVEFFYTNNGVVRIGEYFGKHYSTVIYAKDQIQSFIEINDSSVDIVKKIVKYLEEVYKLTFKKGKKK